MDLLEEEANLHEVETNFNRWKRTPKSLGARGVKRWKWISKRRKWMLMG
jgi:hypothetical protein